MWHDTHDKRWFSRTGFVGGVDVLATRVGVEVDAVATVTVPSSDWDHGSGMIGLGRPRTEERRTRGSAMTPLGLDG